MDRRSRELVYIDGSDYAKDCEFLGQISYEYYVIRLGQKEENYRIFV